MEPQERNANKPKFLPGRQNIDSILSTEGEYLAQLPSVRGLLSAGKKMEAYRLASAE